MITTPTRSAYTANAFISLDAAAKLLSNNRHNDVDHVLNLLASRIITPYMHFTEPCLAQGCDLAVGSDLHIGDDKKLKLNGYFTILQGIVEISMQGALMQRLCKQHREARIKNQTELDLNAQYSDIQCLFSDTGKNFVLVRSGIDMPLSHPANDLVVGSPKQLGKHCVPFYGLPPQFPLAIDRAALQKILNNEVTDDNHTFQSRKLRELTAAAREFFSTADPADSSTWTTKSAFASYLVNNFHWSKSLADEGAAIAQPEYMKIRTKGHQP